MVKAVEQPLVPKAGTAPERARAPQVGQVLKRCALRFELRYRVKEGAAADRRKSIAAHAQKTSQEVSASTIQRCSLKFISTKRKFGDSRRLSSLNDS
eukprot:7046743-Prymnesium_polylepis.1